MAKTPFTLGRGQVEYLLDTSPESITRWQDLATDPLPVKARGKRGQSNEYDPRHVLLWAVRRETQKLRPGGAEAPDYNTERARLTKAQADHEEIKVAILRGDIIPAALVIEHTTTGIIATRAKILGVPSKLRNRHPGMAQELVDEITALLHEALDELASAGMPGDLRARLADMLGTLEAAAESSAQSVG